MTPIDQCATCLAIEQKIELDYDKDKAKRPPILETLEVVATKRDDGDSVESWTTHLLLRCRTCGTAYKSYRNTDEGHSFMDPTCDNEQVSRLTPHLAGAALERFPGAKFDPAPPSPHALAGDLATLLIEQRAPNWHIQKFAIECVMDECLLGDDDERLVATLLRHADPVVRVESAHDLLILATSNRSHWVDRAFTSALAKPAIELVTSEDGMPMLAGVLEGVLAVPPRPSFEFNTDFRAYRPENTHTRAAQTLATIAQKTPLPDSVVERLLEMLLQGDSERFHAVWALLYHSGTAKSGVPALLARVESLPEAVRAAVHVDMLEKSLRKKMTKPAQT